MVNNPNAQVFQMFPVPLYITNFDGDTTEMVKYFDSCKLNEYQPGYGHISENSYIVDNPVCKPLADFVMKSMTDFAVNCMSYDEELEFSQSWLTYKAPNQAHKAHSHPNTIIASVFYFDAEEGDSPICFSKEVKAFNRSYLEPSLREDYQSNPFAQDEIFYYPKLNDLIIFPSWVMHGVPPNPKQKMRKCLGINALTKGKLGDTHTISGIDYGRYINE